MYKTAINSRFKKVVEALKENGVLRFQNSLSEITGIHKQIISDIINGKRNLTVEHMSILFDKLSVNPVYLLGNTGPMFMPTDKNINNIKYVPVKAQAGYGDQIHSAVLESCIENFYIPGNLYKDGDYTCFEVEGDSMHPSYLNGDKVICSQIPIAYLQQALKDMMAYIIVTDSSLLLKRVINKIKENNTIELISENDYYEKKILHKKDIREIWKVEGVITNRVFAHRKKDE